MPENEFCEELGLDAPDYLAGMKARQEALVHRGKASTDAKPAKMNAKKRHRKDTCLWIVDTDHCLRESTGIGLKHYQITELKRKTAWDTWPLLSYAGDQGPVEIAGVNALQSYCSINVDVLGDPGHGVWNDAKLAFQQCGLWNHVNLMILTWNVPHGPWSEDQRYSQLKRHWRNIFDTCEQPEQSPLFMGLVHRIIFDRNLKGDNRSLVHLIWEKCKGDEWNPFEKKGCKLSKNRFMGPIEKGIDEEDMWTINYLGFMHCCMEEGWLSDAKMKKIQLAQKATAQEEANRTTKAVKASAFELAVVKACQNQVVVGAMMLSDPQTQYRQRAINSVMRPQLKWHKQQAHQLRSHAENHAWMVGQISTDLMSCLQDTIDTIGHPHVLRSVGFTVPDVSSSRVYRLNDGEVAAEDALANTMGQLACSMVGKRLLRCQYFLSGWSCRSILWITDPDKDKHSITNFKADLEVHKWVMADTSGELQEYQMRSQFQLLPVEQLALAMEEAGYEMTDKVAGFLAKKHQRIISSQISEDAFQRQKRRKQQHLNRRLNLLENYNILQVRRLVSEVHKYTAVVPDTDAQARRDHRVSPKVFEPSLRQCSVDIKGISSTKKQKTPYYSPPADRSPVRFSDCHLMRYAMKRGNKDMLHNLWLNMLVNVNHRVLIREKLAGGKVGPPMFCLCALAGGLSFGWPAVEGTVPKIRPAAHFYVPKAGVTHEECHIPFYDLRHWQMASYEWRSSAYQWQIFPAAREHWGGSGLRIRAYTSSTWDEPLKVAALKGFWRLSNDIVKSIADFTGADCNDENTLFQNVLSSSMHILNVDEDKGLECCTMRAAEMETTSAECADALCEADECLGLMEKDDEKQATEIRDKLHMQQSTADTFLESLGKQTAKKARGRAGSSRVQAYPPFPKEAITQSTLAKLCPPGGYIWRGNGPGIWHCHYKPWPRKSYSWGIYGHDKAGKMCLRYMWMLQLKRHGKTKKDCPVKNLFGKD